jgi:hypothetical protein
MRLESNRSASILLSISVLVKGAAMVDLKDALSLMNNHSSRIVASPTRRRGETPQRHSQPYGFVGMIDGRYPDGRYPETRYDPHYAGFMRVEIRRYPSDCDRSGCSAVLTIMGSACKNLGYLSTGWSPKLIPQMPCK